MIDRSFLKESGFGVVVLLQFGDRGDMPEILLWDVVIIEVKILLQGGFQVTGGGESGGFQHLGDAAVEAFDHAVGLGMFGLNQHAMFDFSKGDRSDRASGCGMTVRAKLRGINHLNRTERPPWRLKTLSSRCFAG